MDSMLVAKTILSQLGGNRFLVMTGAKSLVGGANFLAFRLPRANDGINYVRVTLNGKDLYKVEYGRATVKGYKPIAGDDDIYAEDLVRCFEATTGLATRL
ncbi:MAG: hypothetical protein E6Q97_19510 [Desulfurellales bacterium]|nr:MAG: hypothetical protein E6Q97_19510 [Desulfurellales bacterium]